MAPELQEGQEAELLIIHRAEQALVEQVIHRMHHRQAEMVRHQWLIKDLAAEILRILQGHHLATVAVVALEVLELMQSGLQQVLQVPVNHRL